MNKSNRHTSTELNENDRKILGKYTRFYTNFIESNTARSDMLEENFHKEKE